MKFIKIYLIVILFFLKAFAIDDFTANLAFTKAIKLVEKEEEIALAYKEHILEKGTIPSTEDLKAYLTEGYSLINDFGSTIELVDSIYILNEITDLDIKQIAKFYDYYYSTINRINTIPPISVNSANVKIKLSSFEDFIYNNISLITTNLDNVAGKYLLSNGSLIWYDNSGNKIFSYNGDSVIVFNGNLDDELKILLAQRGVLKVGTKIYAINGNAVNQTLYIKDGVFESIGLGEGVGTYLPAKLLLTLYSGGYLLNGDIYTWGNNKNRLITLKNDESYIGLPFKLRVKNYDDILDSKNYFSSPFRTKFMDFFTTTDNGTCAISNNFELYCTGLNASKDDYIVPNLLNLLDTDELLYKVSWFDGEDIDLDNYKFGKANKILAVDKRWFVLANGKYDSNNNFTGSSLYTWGSDSDGFAGNGDEKNERDNIPQLISFPNDIKAKDIAFSYEINYRKMYALGSDGFIYLWGMDEKNSDDKCNDEVDNVNMNLCEPTKVDSNEIVFKNIRNGARNIIATTVENNFYTIFQDKDDLPEVINLHSYISNYRAYNTTDDSEIISIDAVAKDDYRSDELEVVWINSKNELKGDYNILNLSSSNEDKLDLAIKNLSWLKVKMIGEKSICAMTTNYQIYCWGDIGFKQVEYESTIIPAFSTNLFSSFNLNGIDIKDDPVLYYPTFIGGFNYNFSFK